MIVDVARTVDEALALLADRPNADIMCGGTDLMVEINFGRKRPEAVVAIDRVEELRGLSMNGRVKMGAGVTFTTMLERDCGSVALREAARTVGSPQIRNAATIGGNVATSSPAGDALPVLAALDAKVHLRSTRGARVVPFGAFMTGPKKNVRASDELVTVVEWDDAGPAQVFMKVGTRNAMVIAVAGLALVADRARKRIGVGLGSCGPTILRAPVPRRSRPVSSTRPAGVRSPRATRRARSSDPRSPPRLGRSTTCAARPRTGATCSR